MELFTVNFYNETFPYEQVRGVSIASCIPDNLAVFESYFFERNIHLSFISEYVGGGALKP